jgi:FkbM family methyltransferase
MPTDLRALRAALLAPTGPTVPPRLGTLRRALWPATRRFVRRHEERRDALMLELVAALDELQAQVARRGGSPAIGPVLNGDSGALVLSRYRPVVERALEGEACRLDAALELVHSDVGELLFPAFDRFILPSIRANGSWEPHESTFIRAHLRPGMRAMNVGANVGYTALVMAGAVGDDGTVIALEPDPLNFSLLWHNLERNGAVRAIPIHAAAGDATGSISLQQSPDNAGDHRTTHQPLSVNAVDVPVVRVDDLLPEDARLDLVSVDAQGFDHRIVRGMTALLERCHPHLLVEFWPSGIMETGDDPTAVIAEYRALGYPQMQVLTTGSDVSTAPPEAVVAEALDGRDHVTLPLSP